MKKLMLTLAIGLSGLTLPALAQAQPEMLCDADGDGFVSWDELDGFYYPDVTTEGFEQADQDDDGLLTYDEVETARGEGLIPPSDM